MGQGGGMMGGWNTASYLDRLKTRLAIRPEQEAAWKEYADTVDSAGSQMQAMHKAMFESMDTATWEERRTQMNQMFQARQQAFDMVHQAATKLLPSLDEKQKTQAQSILPGLSVHHRMMGRRSPYQ